MWKQLVAVYWTLKRGMGNFWTMERAEWVYVKDAYIEVEKLDTCGYPMVRMATKDKPTGKWLLVELFEVDKAWIEGPLDGLEGYTPGALYNHYNRIEVKTLEGDEVGVYEINRENIPDVLENYFTHKEGDNLFYNWNR